MTTLTTAQIGSGLATWPVPPTGTPADPPSSAPTRQHDLEADAASSSVSRRRGFAARIEAATPPDRDRLLDGLRGFALLGVIVGHWFVTGFQAVAQPGGRTVLQAASPLATFGWTGPLTWVVAVIGVFFLVGGRVSAASWRRAQAGGRSYRSWLAGRAIRLLRPVTWALVAWAGLAGLALAVGVPTTTLAAVGLSMVQPLWFSVVYLGLTALTPLAVWLDERFGTAAPIGLALAVAGLDLACPGRMPVSFGAPAWLCWLALVPGWLFPYQLGVRWGSGWVTRRRGTAWLVAGAGVALVLLVIGAFPASIVGGPDMGPSAIHPPSLALLSLEAIAAGAVWRWETALRGLFSRPRIWAAAVVPNLAPVTVLAWHQLAAGLPAILAVAVGARIPGLTSDPGTVAWLLARPVWMVVFGAVLAAVWRLFRPIEAGRKPGGRSAASAVGRAGSRTVGTVNGPVARPRTKQRRRRSGGRRRRLVGR